MVADTRIVAPNTGEVIAFPGDILDDEVLYRLEVIGLEMNGHQPRPFYAFRTYRCTSCGKLQYDAGQIGAGCDTGTCLVCGAFWTLKLIWPRTSPSANADEGA